MTLVELKAVIPPGDAEAIDEQIQESGLTGWNILEDVIAHTAGISGVFESEAAAREAWTQLAAVCPLLATVQPQWRALEEREWRDSYKAHFKAWQFGPLHWVPVWERETFQLPSGHEVLWLDPGLAFGTGNHETTRLCVERLVEWSQKADKSAAILDAGCGSGILALSAAKLGFTRVAGFDNDPEAVRVSEENAELNALAGCVEFYEGDLISGLEGRRADLIMANILGHVLVAFAPQLVASVAPGGTLVLSGILAQENPEVCAAFQNCAPDWAIEHRILGEWSDVQLKRPV
ncbi:MAG: 50S ribosomal protein L11 methyltransferase [Opitutaceae bacterium]|nr:50S ribosomal protein L11 methyltransferase [Cephaloticoccus sp.]MCP5531191.1 50S ribosomal protein L11 methyltransferase [Opitutaceae bacterium]